MLRSLKEAFLRLLVAGTPRAAEGRRSDVPDDRADSALSSRWNAIRDIVGMDLNDG